MYNKDKPSGKKPFISKDGKPPARKWTEKRPPASRVSGLAADTCLWGDHAVIAAWANPARRIKRFFASENALKDFQPHLDAARAAGLKRPEATLHDRAGLDRMVGPTAVHQGLIIEVEPLEEIFIADLAVRGAAAEKSVLVLLDQVTDPHNVGAILRSASAFGAHGVIMQSRHAPELTGTLAKAACGAVEHIPVAYETNLGRALAYLKEQGYTAIGLDERGEKTIAEIPVPAKTVLLLGAEGKGLRQNLRESSDIVARLPTQGAIQSLNVSNAAAVALYALVSTL